MPHGFAASHGRFWLNEVAPLPLAGACVFGVVWAATDRRWAVVAATTAGCSIAWVAFGLASLVCLPQTGALQGIASIAFGAGLAASARQVFRAVGRTALVCAGGLGAFGGCAALLVLRAPPPSTRPYATTPSEPDVRPDDVGKRAGSPLVSLGSSSLEPRRGRVYAHVGAVIVELAPLLTFDGRAPDGGWTLFASAADRVGPQRALVSSVLSDARVELSYRDDGWSTLTVADHGRGAGLDLQLVAQSDLRRPIYSHLNTFTELLVRGHRRLSLAFSPCPERAIDVLPSDYPRGRPLRSAHLLADGRFVVVEASSGEKGPFRTLATGPLDRGSPLRVTLLDDGQAIVDTVGHAAGTYRNTVHVTAHAAGK